MRTRSKPLERDKRIGNKAQTARKGKDFENKEQTARKRIEDLKTRSKLFERD